MQQSSSIPARGVTSHDKDPRPKGKLFPSVPVATINSSFLRNSLLITPMKLQKLTTITIWPQFRIAKCVFVWNCVCGSECTVTIARGIICIEFEVSFILIKLLLVHWNVFHDVCNVILQWFCYFFYSKSINPFFLFELFS